MRDLKLSTGTSVKCWQCTRCEWMFPASEFEARRQQAFMSDVAEIAFEMHSCEYYPRANAAGVM